MSYVNDHMMPGEQVRFVGKQSRIMYLNSAICIVIFGALSLAVSVTPMGRDYFALIFYVPLALSLLRFAWVYVVRHTTEIAVTDHRIIHKVGLIGRDVREMSLNKVESVLINQTILGRICNYGVIDVRGTGAGLDGMAYIRAPMNLRNAILAARAP